ncbi:MAG: hypothetical protein C9356_05750 [Oleiphilus sp.]|nr:MAG: hypothetical protein C9356_05750 [Oleiphilus sp.]
MLRLLVLAALLGASACSILSHSEKAIVLSEQDILRQGEAFDLLEGLEQQLINGHLLQESQIKATITKLHQINNPLALADYHWLLAMHHFMQMRTDNRDSDNLNQIIDALQQAKALYGRMGETWAQAKSTLLLAMAHARSSQYKEVCDYYDETLLLLDAGPGRLADFDYDTDNFARPQDYVDGMFGDTCRVLRHDPGRNNFDEYGHLRILERRPS